MHLGALLVVDNTEGTTPPTYQVVGVSPRLVAGIDNVLLNVLVGVCQHLHVLGIKIDGSFLYDQQIRCSCINVGLVTDEDELMVFVDECQLVQPDLTCIEIVLKALFIGQADGVGARSPGAVGVFKGRELTVVGYVHPMPSVLVQRLAVVFEVFQRYIGNTPEESRVVGAAVDMCIMCRRAIMLIDIMCTVLPYERNVVTEHVNGILYVFC